MFQQASDYRRPVWPPADGEQRPMVHFDFQVGDLDSAVAEALALSARGLSNGVEPHRRASSRVVARLNSR